MKHPFWIVNSSLGLIFILALLFMAVSRVSIPEREDIEPIHYSKIKREKNLQINISKIYESDLFGTYKPTSAVDQQEKPEFPEPPQPQAVEIPELPKPQFLEPIDITLRGIFVVSSDASKNSAIIMDNKTKKEARYHVGDKISDAQLIRIFGNKTILLRSNGQQEVLYLREQDAKLDASYALLESWETVIKPIGGFSYLVDPQSFTMRIQDLAQFIEMLRLITAYKQGVSIGCRVGRLDDKSVGIALGLQAGDIIMTVNDIPATTMENRLAIYKDVIKKEVDDTIKVVILRNKEEYAFEYILKDFGMTEGQTKLTPTAQFSLQKIQQEEKLKILQQKNDFAPTIEEIRKREKKNMMNKGMMPQSTTGVTTP